MSSFADFFRRIGAFGRPLDVSAHGSNGDSLFGWITLVIAIVFAVVVGHLLMVLLRSRRTDVPSTSDGDDLRAVLIVGVATLVLALAIDGVALLRGNGDLDALLRRPTADERPIEVEVLGQQWAWAFRLAGADGRFGTDDDIVTLHHLTLPAGRPARLEMRSKDVIHSLYFPQLRIKRDVQPNTTTELLLEPTRAGDYEIACAQHCGVNHYKMRAVLTVTSDADFASYVERESKLAVERAGARTSDGDWTWPYGAMPQ